jgi:integrase
MYRGLLAVRAEREAVKLRLDPTVGRGRRVGIPFRIVRRHRERLISVLRQTHISGFLTIPKLAGWRVVTPERSLYHEELSRESDLMASVFKRQTDRNKKGSNWLFKYKNAEGRWVVEVGCTDKTKTEQLARKRESDALLDREGVRDPREVRRVAQARRPLKEHLDEFHAAIMARNGSEKRNASKHADSTKGYVEWILEETGATRIDDLTPSTVQAAIAKLRKEGRARRGSKTEKASGSEQERGASARTCNAYITAIKSLSRWLWRESRTAVDELAHLEKYNEASDRRRVRRALDAAGLLRLFQAAEDGAEVLGMTGPDRAILYRLAAETGLRASELASLTPRAFKLDATPAFVEVAAAYTKNGETANQPLRPELAALLRPWLAEKPEREPVFDLPEKTAKMLRADLTAAGIAYKDADGGIVDFHALRHTFITLVVNSGASVKVAQVLARHSTPTLTIGRYAHADMADKQAALNALPSLTVRAEEARTGSAPTLPEQPGVTINRPGRAPNAHQTGDVQGRDVSESCAKEGGAGLAPPHCNPLDSSDLGTSGRPVAESDASAPRRTRTYNPLIKSQLLCQLS